MRDDENFFLLRPAGAELLLNILDVPESARILILASDKELVRLAESRGYSVHHADLRQGVHAAFEAVARAEKFDAAIVIPPFGGGHGLPIIDWQDQMSGEWQDARPRSMEDLFLGICASRLQPRGRLVALTPTGLLSSDQRQTAREVLLDTGLYLVASLPNDAFWRTKHSTATNLLALDRHRVAAGITFLDLEGLTELPPPSAWRQWLSGELVTDFGAPQSVIPEVELDESMRLDPQFYNPIYLRLQPPKGYSARSIADLGALNAGIALDPKNRHTERPAEGSVPYVQVRHIQPDGTISAEHFWADASVVAEHAAKLALPGDILITIGGTLGKTVLIPESYPDGLLYDTSLRRLRLHQRELGPEVAAFLRSDLGKMQIERLGGGSVIPMLTSSHLKRLQVFLADAPSEPPQRADEAVPLPLPPPPPDVAQSLIATLRDTILLVERSDDESDWKHRVATALHKLADEIVPKPLESVIREEFPAPIAIAYRRYMMSRVNPYEQLDRLNSLVESCVYFAFHVLLADYCANQWHTKATLSPDARRVFKGDSSIQNRLKFIEEVLHAARQQTVSLFMPELVTCDIASYGDRVRDDLRNRVAHSAPGSEAYVRSLIHGFREPLQEMLEKLKFLREYRLCRIRSHHFHAGQWHYQAELYRGEEYDGSIKEFSPDEAEDKGKLIAAEREHLVLLDSDRETLDLWPFYQLVFSDKTFGESHLCFYKKRQDQRLYGESIRSCMEIDMPGVDDFERLVRPRPIQT